MKTELYRYSIHPLVVKVNRETELEIRPSGEPYQFRANKEYVLRVCGMTRRSAEPAGPQGEEVPATIQNGCLCFRYTFDKEEAYSIRVYQKKAGQKRPELQKNYLRLSVYALEDDLFALRPLKGDFHAHSCRSDGKETPAVVAANYRAVGFDFMALTDHMSYGPSQETQAAYREVSLGMRILNGEEVHTPENYVHIVHVGGSASVNALYEEDDETYYEEVARIQQTLDMPEEYRFPYAACLWAIEKIRAVGGLAIFCHPYWLEDVYNVPEALTRAILKSNAFDAFELLSGVNAYENNLQTALYNDLRAEGCRMPVVGSSDAHHTVNPTNRFNRVFTIVFAEENTAEGILKAVKNRMTAPVEVFENSVDCNVQGPYRLVSYTRFLLEYYFAPQTQFFCLEEGLLMRQYALGNTAAGERLALLHDRTDRYYRKRFGRTVGQR